MDAARSLLTLAAGVAVEIGNSLHKLVVLT
jgi:hypothetical protein